MQPENLLLDSVGNLKVSDFGLSALPQEVSMKFLLSVPSDTEKFDFYTVLVSIPAHINVHTRSFMCVQGVGLLHTTCGTPNYVAPEVYTRIAIK